MLSCFVMVGKHPRWTAGGGSRREKALLVLFSIIVLSATRNGQFPRRPTSFRRVGRFWDVVWGDLIVTKSTGLTTYHCFISTPRTL